MDKPLVILGVTIQTAGVASVEDMAHRIAEQTGGSRAGWSVLLPNGQTVRVRAQGGGYVVEDG